ncbi:MFS transporter [Streptosporangium sandarakinum]|uniref:MFS transporter n=1 Tax=Streptosporangium sandarakinum TaxID=1260955 RepID=UPI0037A74BAA
MVATTTRSPASRPRHAPTAAVRTPRPRLLLMMCAGVMAITMADVVAASFGLPLLRADAGFPSASSVQWVSTTYFTALAAALTVAGRLADVIGRRTLLALGAASFAGAACVVVLAPGWEVLLAARALQGLGAAAMVPASLGVLLSDLPAERRGRAIATWSAGGGLGAVVMHATGGWLATFGWRALFLPSVLAGAALLLAAVRLPRNTGRAAAGRPDVAGVMLLAVSVAALVLAISKGQEWGWTSPALLGCVSGGAGALTGALVRARRHPVPAIDIALWRRRGFGWGWGLSLLHGLISFAVLAWAPMYLQEWGYSGLSSGVVLVPMSVAVMTTGWLAGAIGQRYGLNMIVYVGGSLIAVAGVLVVADGFVSWRGSVLDGILGPAAPSWPTLVASVICGVGLGCLATGSSTVSALAADPAQYATAVGASMTARQTGGAIGVAGAAVLVEHPLLARPLEEPMAGYLSVFAAVLALAVVTAVMALLRSLLSREGTLRVARPINGDPTEMIAIPRATLLALRQALAEVTDAAHELLPAQGPSAGCGCHPQLDVAASALLHDLDRFHTPSLRSAAPAATGR